MASSEDPIHSWKSKQRQKEFHSATLYTIEPTVSSAGSVMLSKGGRTRTDKIGVGAGVDIVVATSTTQVW